MSDRAWVLKYQLECDKVQWLQTHCGQAWISLDKSLSTPKLLHGGFCLYFSVLRSTSVRSSMGLKISARVRQSSMTSNTLRASVNFFGQITIQRYFVFVSTEELRTLYTQELPYMNTLCECILKKIGPASYARTFSVKRNEINFVKVRLYTMMYSSRKLNNKKVITIACNFWRQIVCCLQVYGGTNHHKFCAKSTRKTLFWIFRFFHLTNIDVTSCFCRQFFRPLYEDKGQKIAILFANISEMLASTELKLHSMFILFILNTFH